MYWTRCINAGKVDRVSPIRVVKNVPLCALWRLSSPENLTGQVTSVAPHDKAGVDPVHWSRRDPNGMLTLSARAREKQISTAHSAYYGGREVNVIPGDVDDMRCDERESDEGESSGEAISRARNR